jgi:N-acetylmuramoyl-L-alanine amidase
MKMTANLTKKEFIKWLNASIGKQYDTDNYAGYQCFDYANAGWLKLFGHSLKGEGAADIPNVNNFKGEATVYNNTPEFLAKPGDLVVFNRNYGGGYGHVAWVIEATLNYIVVYEQNWLGGGWVNGAPGWETVTKRKHNYDFPMWFIRPIFKSETASKKSAQSATKATPKKKAPAKKKETITVSTKRINYNMTKRGYKPTSIVIHNDAGSSTGKQYENALVNAGEQRYFNGIAHAYGSKGYVWEGVDEDRIAFHTGDGTSKGTGNHEAYGIEVCQSMSASDKAFLQNEQTVFQFVADKLTKWKLPANRNTVRLHMEYVPTACPHQKYEIAYWLGPC